MVFLASLAVAFLISVPTAFADPNLISWWKFDEGTGSTAHDSAGSNDGTITGAAWSDDPCRGMCLSFDGSGDYVLIGDKDNLEQQAFTLSFWARLNNPSGSLQGGIAKGHIFGTAKYYSYKMDFDSGYIWPAITNTSDAGFGLSYPIGGSDWHMWSMTVGSGTLTLYKDGAFAGSTAYTGTVDYTKYNNNFVIGARSNGYYAFYGKIDDVLFRDTALSAEEIWLLYQEMLVFKASNPNPANGVTGVVSNIALSWSPGENAASHDVYFGTDYNDVNNADTSSPEYKGNFDVNTFDPGGLDFFKTYYWRIDEVNDPNLWKGKVWSFEIGGPEIRLSASHFVFASPLGGANPNVQTLGISNIGQDSLCWQITEDCSWLSAEPNKGSSAGEIDDVNLSVDISGLAMGKYTCSLAVSDINASNNPQTVGITLYVIDPNGILCVPSEYPTIQAAIDASVDGNTVVVAPGTYIGAGNIDIDFKGKAITVRSADPNDPNTVAATIVDYRSATWENHSGFYLHSGEDANSILAGFTITNNKNNTITGISALRSSPTITNCIISNNFFSIDCYDSNLTISNCTISDNMDGINCRLSSPTITNCTISGNNTMGINCSGGNFVATNCVISDNSNGIYCYNNSNPTITNCTITNNSTNNDGGGIYCEDSNAIITGCTISGNSADYGGGIYCYLNSPKITNCNITANTAYDGGGVYCDDSNAIITGCTITDNSAGYGGAIYSENDSMPLITDCTISGNSTDRGVYCYNSDMTITGCTISDNPSTGIHVDGNATITNCTIKNNGSTGIFCMFGNLIITGCTISNNGGGGIRYRDGSPISSTITDCTISGNSAQTYASGGGIYGCSGPITNCTITGNSIYYENGGGLASCSGPITNCVISGNYSTPHGYGSGGGIYECDGPITNCIISGNSAGAGGGLARCDCPITNCIIAGNCAEGCGGGMAYCYGPMTNCTIIGNSASEGGGMFSYEGPISNCIIWDNGPDQILGRLPKATYSNVQGGWPGEGNIDADPYFADADANDYHLKSAGWRWDNTRRRWDWDDVTSRCIDAGNPGSPLGDELLSVPDDPNNEWGQNLRIDMGAFGGTAEASIPPYDWALLSDTTNDGTSDFGDLDILSSLWLNTGEQLYADFNRDGIVDLFDFATLTQDWLNQTSWH